MNTQFAFFSTEKLTFQQKKKLFEPKKLRTFTVLQKKVSFFSPVSNYGYGIYADAFLSNEKFFFNKQNDFSNVKYFKKYLHFTPKMDFNLFLTKGAPSLSRAIEILVSNTCSKKNKIRKQFTEEKDIFFSFWASQIMLKKKQKKKSSYFAMVFFADKHFIKAENSNGGSEPFYCMFLFWTAFGTNAFFYYYNPAMQFAMTSKFFVTEKKSKKTCRVFFALYTVFQRKTNFFLTSVVNYSKKKMEVLNQQKWTSSNTDQK
jgi:hypothetical protein